jgi:hypothetical protein
MSPRCDASGQQEVLAGMMTRSQKAPSRQAYRHACHDDRKRAKPNPTSATDQLDRRDCDRQMDDIRGLGHPVVALHFRLAEWHVGGCFPLLRFGLVLEQA